MPKPYASAVIDAPVDEVWTLVRAFGGIAAWHPALDTCVLTGGDDRTVGAVRRLTAGDAVFVERLTGLDDAARTQTYEFLESPFPVRAYRATIRVAPVTASGATFAEWWAEYEADEADTARLTPFFRDAVYAAGLAELGAHLAARR
ncbi:SRPBCC family protein [Actinomadura logoneensis]|uniref:SRPBCC family protein n=1 Tax=Actinomadura logoneensis TaxID=2293572 RepID=A0A372JSK5_9ACTN|nr:SRPBCC family protein [Actinomadura logoneensis]RFU43001.1 SRPBCC family protein [Actinomadura logoneensis]